MRLNVRMDATGTTKMNHCKYEFTHRCYIQTSAWRISNGLQGLKRVKPSITAHVKQVKLYINIQDDSGTCSHSWWRMQWTCVYGSRESEESECHNNAGYTTRMKISACARVCPTDQVLDIDVHNNGVMDWAGAAETEWKGCKA